MAVIVRIVVVRVKIAPCAAYISLGLQVKRTAYAGKKGLPYGNR